MKRRLAKTVFYLLMFFALIAHMVYYVGTLIQALSFLLVLDFREAKKKANNFSKTYG